MENLYYKKVYERKRLGKRIKENNLYSYTCPYCGVIYKCYAEQSVVCPQCGGQWFERIFHGTGNVKYTLVGKIKMIKLVVTGKLK